MRTNEAFEQTTNAAADVDAETAKTEGATLSASFAAAQTARVLSTANDAGTPTKNTTPSLGTSTTPNTAKTMFLSRRDPSAAKEPLYPSP